MRIEDVVFPLPLKQVGGCIEVDAPRLTNRKLLNWGGGTWLAHRLSYRLNCEEIPRRPPSQKEGLILHSCDNGWCVDPDHLSIGTAKQNMQEKSKRNSAWRKKMSEVVKSEWDSFSTEEKLHKARGLKGVIARKSNENHSR